MVKTLYSGASANNVDVTINRFMPTRLLIIPPAIPPNAAESENIESVQLINVESLGRL